MKDRHKTDRHKSVRHKSVRHKTVGGASDACVVIASVAKQSGVNCLNHDSHDLRIGRYHPLPPPKEGNFAIANHAHHSNHIKITVQTTACDVRRQCRDGARPVSTIPNAVPPSPNATPPPPHAVIAGLTRNPIVFGRLRVVARNDGTGSNVVDIHRLTPSEPMNRNHCSFRGKNPREALGQRSFRGKNPHEAFFINPLKIFSYER